MKRKDQTIESCWIDRMNAGQARSILHLEIVLGWYLSGAPPTEYV